MRLTLLLVATLTLCLRAHSATCIAPPSGLVGWWSGDYTTGDSAGTNHGQFVGASAYGPGLRGAAFSFAGSSYINVPDQPALRPTNLTLVAWVNPASFANNSWDTIATRGSSGGTSPLGCCGNTYGLFFNSGRLQFITQHAFGGTNITATNAVALNQWHQVAATYDGSEARLYLNGALVTNRSFSSPLVYDSNAVPFTIAEDVNNNAAANLKFNGLIDEVDLYNRALSGGEIQALYNAGGAGKCFAPAKAAGTPYFTDFEAGSGPEWSDSTLQLLSASFLPTDGSQTYFTRFLGRYSNQAALLTLTNLAAGQPYTLQFDFYPIDSWDGGTAASSDYFNVGVDGQQAFHYSFANYNGNPPSSPQTWPGAPDEGRANYGFQPSYVDAVYRSIEIQFVPSNSTATLSFSGQNLQDASDESWGIDNIRVRRSSTIAGPSIHSTSLSGLTDSTIQPFTDSTASLVIEEVRLSATAPLLAGSVTASTVTLREAGINGVLGDGDDVTVPVTPAFTSGHTITLALPTTPLQAGKYRLQTTTGLQDTNGAALAAFTRDFTVANPAAGRIENTANGSVATATALPVAENPAGSGFYTAFGLGSISTTDVDYWRFDAEAGDVLSVRLESDTLGVYPQLQLRNASDSNLGTWGGSYEGITGFQNLVISTPGSYYLRVYSNNGRGRYQLRLDQARSLQLESEANDAQNTANLLSLFASPGLYQGRVAGAIVAEDSAGDYSRLGTLNAGNTITLNTLFPTGSVLRASDVVLSVQFGGNAAPFHVTNSGVAILNYVVPSNGVYYARIETTNRNIRSQYLLNVAVSDAVPPEITSIKWGVSATDIPPGGSTSAIVDRLSLSFSEDLAPSTVTNQANYDLRAAGPDATFNTADDILYPVVCDGYSSGLGATYSLPNAPLQPGNYRFTIGVGVRDRANNSLASAFVRNFSVTNVPGYTIENRYNDNLALATPMVGPQLTGDGTVSLLQIIGVQNNPQAIIAGQFNSDTNRDVVSVNFNGDSITVLTNTARRVNDSTLQQFNVSTNIPTGDGAVGGASGDLNGDAIPDLAIANYYANTVTILLGNGQGGFTVLSNLTGFSQPYNLALSDLNGDGKLDLIVPSYGAARISVFVGNGNGSFQAGTNYTTGSNPQTAVVGDLNGDGRPDVLVANYSSASVSIFTNGGGAALALSTNLPVGAGPRRVALADVSGDGVADLIVLQASESSISVFRGNVPGSATFFQPRADFPTSTTDPYDLALGDLNGDGRLDIVVPGYGNNTISVLLNSGAGGFSNLYNFGHGGNPIGGVVADFTGDGIPDLATVNYYGQTVSLFSGNAASYLAEDPPASGMRSAFARGNLSFNGDVDFYRFTGTAGERVMLAVDVPGNPGGSSLNCRITYYEGSTFTSFNSDSSGWGQSSPLILPYTGAYYARLSANNDFQGEYRIRVTSVRSPTTLETEANNSVAQANGLTFALTNVGGGIALQQASVGGFLHVADSSGDHYSLGNLSEGTTITLKTAQPSFSGLAAVLSILDGAGNVVATTNAGKTNFVFTVPAGQGGPYYARVTAGLSGYPGNASFAVNFDGNDDYVGLGTWTPGSRWTVQAWVRPSSAPSGRRSILGGFGNCTDWGISMQDGQFVAAIRQPGGCSLSITSGVFALPGTWYHVAASSDGSIARVYVNGVLRNTGSVEPEYTAYNSPRIGSEACCGNSTFPGLIDEPAVWNRALTDSDIANLGATTAPSGIASGLIGYWPFNEGSGGAVTDASSGGHDGSLASGAYFVGLGSPAAQPPGLAAVYLLSVDMADTQPPYVVAVDLPPQSSTTSNLVNAFTVSFNEDIDPKVNKLDRSFTSFGGHAYFVTDTTMNWPEAESWAVSQGGHLASIASRAENDWIVQSFSGYGNLWIGLNDAASEGNFVWTSGEPLTFSNWNPGEPNNSGNEDYGMMYSSGLWNDAGSGNYRGLVEISSSADADADGIPDAIDAYPNDSRNGFDLRAAGVDGQFDTADDVVYHLNTIGTYVAGTNISFAIIDGPLQSGNYRFRVTTNVIDRSGNGMAAPYTRNFSVASVGGYIAENRTNNAGATGTSLSLAPSPLPDGSFAYFNAFGVQSSPEGIVMGHFNADTNLDVVVANYNSASVSLLRGNGDGTFQTATNFSTPNNPVELVSGDLVGDTNLDLAVACYNSGFVSVLVGDGAGGFQTFSNFSVPTPISIRAADLNNDGFKDLITSSYNGNSISVLIASNGTFRAPITTPIPGTPDLFDTADLDHDGKLDLVLGSYGADVIRFLRGNGDGTFQAATTIASVPNPRAVTLGNMNGDTNLDLIVFGNGDNRLRIFMGNSDGTFQTPAIYDVAGNDIYQILVTDLNFDGKQDVVLPMYGANNFATLLNSGDGGLYSYQSYSLGGNPIGVVAGDLNSDGRPDLVVTRYNSASVYVLLSNPALVLPPTLSDSSTRTSQGRGSLSDASDVDYWRFSAQAGDMLNIAVEVPGNPGASGLSFVIDGPTSRLTSFYSDYAGWGQSAPVTVPSSGTYTLRVEPNYNFFGEYRFRVTLVRPPVQVETEDNSNTGQANTLSLAFSPGHQRASVFGYQSVGDGNGDYYRLGNLAVGTTINLGLRLPTNTTFVPVLQIHSSTGMVAVAAAGVTNLAYPVPSGGDGAYYVRVIASAGAGILAQYLLDIDLADTQPPSITAVNLPLEGTISSNIIDRFTLTFSEDMAAATVTNAANYQLRGAGADGVFGTGDDLSYTVLNTPAYGSGLSSSYLVTDGPLQPGLIRLTVGTNLTDRAGLNMTNAFVRVFSISNVLDFVFERRTNNSRFDATSFSGAFSNASDGSFQTVASLPLPQNPYYMAAARLNADANYDLVVANYGSGSISVLLGNGDGTFVVRTNQAVAPGSLHPVLAHLNGDASLDLVVVNYNNASVSVLLGNGDGTFQALTNYSVGNNPHSVAVSDFNADGKLDLAVANISSGNVSVLLGNGNGTFNSAVPYSVGSQPSWVESGDINKDGKLDLVVANQNSDNISILLGNGDGTFSAGATLAANSTPRCLALADLDGDGNLDIAVTSAGDNTMQVMLGNGNGTFQSRITYGTGTSDSYHIVASDVNGDGKRDLLVSGFSAQSLTVFLNTSSPSAFSLEPGAFYPSLASGSLGIATADFNNDGRVDVALTSYYGHYVVTLLNNATETLAPTGAAAGFSAASGRGVLSTGADVDYWSFSAVAGQRALFSTQIPGNPGASQLHFIIYRPDGNQYADFYPDYYGRGEYGLVMNYSGRYTVRVENNYTYPGEYRLRVLLAPATVSAGAVIPLSLESEGNDGVNQANTPTFTTSAGHRRAAVLGQFSGAESSGDFFSLGNLSTGSTINLQFLRRGDSALSAALWIYNGSGTLLSNSAAGITNLSFTVTNAGSYFARITAEGGTAGLSSAYQLNLDVADSVPPAVANVSLPAAGSTFGGLIDRFDVTVNEDLDSAFNVLRRSVLNFGGHGYVLTDNSGNWASAQAQAKQLGGNLVTINSAAESEWVTTNFPAQYWIGLTDEAVENNWVWISGEPFTYTNWLSGEPNGGRGENYGILWSAGKWADYNSGGNYRGIVEVAGTDTDGDGIPDALDPFPTDRYNLFDLRTAGADGLFDTVDDEVYRLSPGNYSSGLTIGFTILDGPLQPGQYRFRVTKSLRDRFGNAAPANSDRFFAISDRPGYIVENRFNDDAPHATPLIFTEDPAGMLGTGGRGNLSSNADGDWWSFAGLAGESMLFSTEVPGFPGASQLHYEIFNPAGTRILDFYPNYTGEGQAAPLTLASNGTYTLRVTVNYGYYGEYRFKLARGALPVQFETEANESISAANPVTFSFSGESRFASVGGFIRYGTDLDYVNLGTITNGSSVFLSVRQPVTSALSPVVSIYNSANAYQTEAPGGRASDGVAEVRVSQTGTYYAVVRSSEGTAGIDQQYVLDIQVVPTGSVSFPNLQVVSVGLPTGGTILSGQSISFTYTVQNVGSLATPVGNWSDRAVLSLNTVLGDTDDIPAGVLPHSGALNPGDSYTVTNTLVLPDGIAGSYYIIVQTDAGNAVNEFLLEADNTTASSSAFAITRAPYPDLVVENLSVTGPDSGSVYTIAWTTANRGTGPAGAGFRERIFVRNQTSGNVLLNVEDVTPSSLAVNGTLARSRTVTATAAGTYLAQITTDSRNDLYEYDAASHASAEQNIASASFAITQLFHVDVASNPAAAGTVSGSGDFVSGSIVNVNASANTNALPYFFVNWTENGVFQSSSTNFNFILTRDRTLTANFALPSFLLTASNNPPSGGTVAGQGSYVFGTTNLLTATANAGYKFTNWTENGAVVGISNVLSTVVKSNRTVVANYVEANTFHVVTTATSPSNLVVVAGGGTYNNGQSTVITAPLALTNAGNVYTFREFRLNGALAGTVASFNKSFSTQDPTNMLFVAFYNVSSLKPVVASAFGVVTNAALGGYTVLASPVGAISNYQFVARFDRVMNTNFEPTISISNSAASVQPVVSAGGRWFTTTLSNDSYRTPFVTLGAGMDGTHVVNVSLARDTNGLVMDATNALSFVVDATPPAHPVISLVGSNNTYATFDWNGYSAPSDLNAFRVYLTTSNVTSVAGLTPITTLPNYYRSYTYYGLTLDQPYYAVIAAVDLAGNSATTVIPRSFSLPTTVPPPVTAQIVPQGADSAQVTWYTYNTAYLLGFAGFKIYYETSNFTSVAALTPRRTLAAGNYSTQFDALDRTRTYYFAVVGYNGTNGFNPAVSTAVWRDPFAGTISANLTMGGAGQVIDILQSVMVTNNATLTVQPGTTLRFAPGTGLTVQQGRLVANGTALDPVVFTSTSDPGNTPTAGSWNGVTLASGAGSSLLRHVFVQYGAGLVIDGCSPTVDAFTARYNAGGGLVLLNNATLTTADALLDNNGIGAAQSGPAQLIIRSSVLKNNSTNAFAAGTASLIATQNWWGSAVSGDVDAGIQGNVQRSSFLAFEPLLTPAVGIVSNLTQTGARNINMRLACRTAESYRLSEDSTFSAVFFTTFSNTTPFILSDGGGLKTIFAQYRSITGQTSSPVSVAITYITAGPSSPAFNLAEGQQIKRPIVVTGSASAPLGMSAMEFYVGDVLQASQPGGAFSYTFDVRTFTNGIYRVKMLARDTAGNFSSVEHNVVLAPEPPSPPAITLPGSDIVVNTNGIAVAGTAERGISVRLLRGGTVIGTMTASAAGTFGFTNVTLSEGANAFTAVAFDDLGSANSAVRNVVLDSGPPAAVILASPNYLPNSGVSLSWQFAPTGERATRFRVFWHTNSFSNPALALGQSPLLTDLEFLVPGLPSGTWYFSVVGYDGAGNASPLSNMAVLNNDPVPPAFTVGFDKSSPVGVGPLRLILTSSEPLARTPSLVLRPRGSAALTLTVSNTALNTYEGTMNVNAASPSGLVDLTISAQDVAGNLFNGAPSGPSLIIDVQPPSAVITVSPTAPVQVTNSTDVAVSVTLSERPKPGTTPQLSFNPPAGSPASVMLSGSGTNWSGTLTLNSSMGSGNGGFSFTAVDGLDNVGHLITAGAFLEIYNTDLPTPPGQPVGFQATALVGGRIRLNWFAVSNAEVYSVYRDPGSNQFARPTTLQFDGITSNSFIDLPPADGSFMYAITASRRGAEGTNSITRVSVSDRTPPPAPTNVTVQLLASGVRVAWQAGAGETPARYNVYRNGSLIATTTAPTPIIDAPPRGTMSYTVGAADTLGNEAVSLPASIDLIVGAVNNFQVIANIGQAPVLMWSSGDATAVGYNIYRNGIKQNASPILDTTFVDSLGLVSGDKVAYAVRSVNATNAESAPRSAEVYDVAMTVEGNVLNAHENALLTRWFDKFHVALTNRTMSATLPLSRFELRRTVSGQPALTFSNAINNTVGGNNWVERDIVFPASPVLDAQSMRLRAIQETDTGGSVVIYQATTDFPLVSLAQSMIQVAANQQPLAGGLATFSLTIFNRGYADMDFVVTRNNGSDPGDLYMSVYNQLGSEVSRTEFNGTPPGTIFTSDGRGFVRIPAGGSKTIDMPNVLVPEALGTNLTFFQAVITNTWYALGTANEIKGASLDGLMGSSLSVTPYVGTAQTDRSLYANDDVVHITGQALDRVTGAPKANATLKIGFFTRGYRYYSSITTDGTGSYAYDYTPPPGLSGTLKIWAAHPDVFDVLNQAEVKIYRAYLSPSVGDIRMTKNDTLSFSLILVNPGDEVLTGFTLQTVASKMVGTNKVTITNITAATDIAPEFVLEGRHNQRVNFTISADLDSPDAGLLDLTLRSAEGASAKFSANMTLLPANPVLAVVDPTVGYAEVSLNRGSLISKTVTIVNRGLRPLLGVTMQPPTNVAWISVNQPTNGAGRIVLPDLPVGATNSFTVVYAPPSDTPLEYFQDKVVISGTNSPAQFTVNLYALVTSSQRGAVQFHVDNILVLPVPNATVRIKNTILEQEYTVTTDVNGYVTVTNLQEGSWAWQVVAAGHSATVGNIDVIANQTVQVDTRLSKSLVTVNFTVVPVPYTDRYEIQIEQTFETHVPAPVLVLDPPQMEFKNVSYGYEATVLVQCKNYGLILMNDVIIRGSTDGNGGSFIPLINYIPVLLPQQSVEIPMKFTFTGAAPSAQQAAAAKAQSSRYSASKCRTKLCEEIDSNGNVTGGVKFPPSFADNASPAQSFADCATGGLGGLGDFVGGLMAIANGCAKCVDGRTAMAIAASMAITYSVLCSPNFSPIPVSPIPCPSGNWLISGLINLLSCIAQAFASPGADDGGGGGGSSAARSNTGYGMGSPGCFAEGTPVLMADGSWKPIERVTTNDVVRTGASARQIAKVREVRSIMVDGTYDIMLNSRPRSSIASVVSAPDRLNDSTIRGFNQNTLRASAEHEIWVDGQGWTHVRNLRAGDWLLAPDGSRVQIGEIRKGAGRQRVFTFVNEGDHVFYANDILVRDSCGDNSASFKVNREVKP